MTSYYIQIFTDTPESQRVIGHIEIDRTETAEELGTRILKLIEGKEPIEHQEDIRRELQKVSVILYSVSAQISGLVKQA